MTPVRPLEDSRGSGLLVLQLRVILRGFSRLVLLQDVVLFLLLNLSDGSHVEGSRWEALALVRSSGECSERAGPDRIAPTSREYCV